jgi:hypothetical protein
MKARVLYIEDRIKRGEFDVASLSVFRYRPGPTIDARTILDQTQITLYCLDDEHGQAVFTEAPPGVDISEEPFIHRTQYRNAQRLLTVTYGTLHELAAAVGDRFKSLIPMYSVARCGGTAMSRAMNRLDNVLSLDEPDVYSNIVVMRPRNGRRDGELVRLLRSCTRLLHKSPHGNVDTLFLKLRSSSIEVGDLMHQAFPAAKNMFLYRNAEAWARSAGRFFQYLHETPDGSVATLGPLPEFFRRLDMSRLSRTSPPKGEQERPGGRNAPLSDWEPVMRAFPLLGTYVKRTLRQELRGFKLLRLFLLAAGQKVPLLRSHWPTPLDYIQPRINAIPSMKILALLWLSPMHRYLALHAQAIPMLAIQYETLVSATMPALEAIFEYCGLPRDQVTIAAGAFAEDSQKNTPIARDRLRVQDSGDLTAELLAQFREILVEHPPTVTPDFVAPNSLELRG